VIDWITLAVDKHNPMLGGLKSDWPHQYVKTTLPA
jgi:hypothetical protein